MAVPAPGRYRVARRSRGVRAAVGEVVDSSTISPQLLLALVRTRVLVRVVDAPVAPALDTKPEPEPEPMPTAAKPAPAPPKAWQPKKGTKQ